MEGMEAGRIGLFFSVVALYGTVGRNELRENRRNGMMMKFAISLSLFLIGMGRREGGYGMIT